MLGQVKYPLLHGHMVHGSKLKASPSSLLEWMEADLIFPAIQILSAGDVGCNVDWLLVTADSQLQHKTLFLLGINNPATHLRNGHA